MDTMHFAIVCFVVALRKITSQDAKEKLILPPKCALVSCAIPICDNYYTPIGECCPVCKDYKTCYYNGKTYRDGESFKDKCNTCHCRNGAAICTKMGCPDIPDIIKPGVCPKPWRFSSGGRCVKMCSSDYACPGDQKCCKNGCGRICRIPTDKTCYYKGKTYTDGESFKDKCNTCHCRNGAAICTKMGCPDIPEILNLVCVQNHGDLLPAADVLNCVRRTLPVQTIRNAVQTVADVSVEFRQPHKQVATPVENDTMKVTTCQVNQATPCRVCTCRSGSVECDAMMCPMCVGHTPPGVCCPICGTFQWATIR